MAAGKDDVVLHIDAVIVSDRFYFLGINDPSWIQSFFLFELS
jgi:hypothetical protein